MPDNGSSTPLDASKEADMQTDDTSCSTCGTPLVAPGLRGQWCPWCDVEAEEADDGED